jgi:hypothetical protein
MLPEPRIDFKLWQVLLAKTRMVARRIEERVWRASREQGSGTPCGLERLDQPGDIQLDERLKAEET